MPVRDSREIEELFDALFLARYRTVLRGGFPEPEYVPGEPHELRYREDFVASALHEVAHWCVAGARRRRLRDFGYWYEPDGRDAATQAAFERCEARNQALEAIFCAACGHPFHPSTDNLAGGGAASDFAAAVGRERATWLARGLPPRAARFERALRERFGRPSGVAAAADMV